VKLIDSLVTQLKFSSTRDAELSWIDGQIKIGEPEIVEPPPLPGGESVELLEGVELTEFERKKAEREKRIKGKFRWFVVTVGLCHDDVLSQPC